eukprot:9617747-Alexandrium_andersonii.AAC.1
MGAGLRLRSPAREARHAGARRLAPRPRLHRRRSAPQFGGGTPGPRISPRARPLRSGGGGGRQG